VGTCTKKFLPGLGVPVGVALTETGLLPVVAFAAIEKVAQMVPSELVQA
jgi:hypothetical protein